MQQQTKKIILTGPECSGKTTLATALARSYNVPFVAEFARDFLSNLGRPYGKYDLNTIAMQQYKSEVSAYEKSLNSPNSLLICDTGLLVLKIWSLQKYETVHPLITSLLDLSHPDLYIIPDWNIPYESDPLRENPEDREELHAIYKHHLEQSKIPWIDVSGSPEERLQSASKMIDSLFSDHS